ncbi:MAG: DUF3990 domain-containing protein [Bacteroidales bacterium]|nr:DUF3990 domain-containing protein [Bacteroidales bacterium]
MILHHGSNVVVKNIDLSKSKPFKDFGKAFYLSENIEQAKEMGKSKVALFGGNIIVSSFQFDESILESQKLNIKIFNEYNEEWADFIFHNRDKKNEEFSHNYDIVYGPIANDNIGNQIFRYKEGYISFEDFIHNLKYKEGATFQYAFCTELAISKLKRV